MKENAKHVIWDSDLYMDEDAMNEWWECLDENRYPHNTATDVICCLGLARRKYTDAEREALETVAALMDEGDIPDPDTERWYEEVLAQLDDERDNLDKEVPGHILAFGDVGRWNGRTIGMKDCGTNIANILHTQDDSAMWWGEDGDIHGRTANHDGSTYILYRIAPDAETAERIMEAHCNGHMTEDRFKALTTSLYPYVADVYGWPQREPETVDDIPF